MASHVNLAEPIPSVLVAVEFGRGFIDFGLCGVAFPVKLIREVERVVGILGGGLAGDEVQDFGGRLCLESINR